MRVNFTVFHIEHRAHELNQLLNLLLGHGYMGSFTVKYLLTASAVLVLCIHRNLLLARIGIPTILLFYSAVFIYQLFGIFLV